MQDPGAQGGQRTKKEHQVTETNKVMRKHHDVPDLNHLEKSPFGEFMKNRYFVNDYIMLEVLGKGAYAEVTHAYSAVPLRCIREAHTAFMCFVPSTCGQVRKAKDRRTHGKNERIYAVKVINRAFKKQIGRQQSELDMIKKEIAIMKKLHHPHVLKLFEVMDDPKVNKLYLVLEYMKGGDLMQIQQGNSKTYTCNPMTDAQVRMHPSGSELHFLS